VPTENFTGSVIAYKMPIIHGRQQQTAIPMRHAAAAHMITKSASKARNVTQSLRKKPTAKPINIPKKMK
jgi:hypothetical protein